MSILCHNPTFMVFTDEISLLKHKDMDRRNGKMETWKQEVMTELALLQNQLQFYKTKNGDFNLQGVTQTSALLKEVNDV